jgi:hypothetical protein
MVRIQQNDIDVYEHATNNNAAQVLNKRKPVHLIPQPTNLTDTTEVNTCARPTKKNGQLTRE